MSSRAAGGRKRQLKPLHEQKTQAVLEPLAYKSRKGFLSRLKHLTAPPPAPMIIPQPIAVCPSLPPSAPTQVPYGVSSPYLVPSSILDSQPPAIPAKAVSQQHGLELDRTRTLQPKDVAILAPFAKTCADVSYKSQIPVHSLSPRPHMNTVVPAEARLAATQESTLAPIPFHPHQRQPRLLPSYPGARPSTASSLVVPPSPYQDTTLLVPGDSRPPLWTESQSHLLGLGRPITTPQGGNEQRGLRLRTFSFSDCQHPRGNSGVNDMGPFVYPPPPSSSPRMTPSSLRTIASSSDLDHLSFGTTPADAPLFVSPKLSPPVLQDFPRHKAMVAKSIVSGSSGSFRSSCSSNSAADSKTTFILPGSRSAARPRVSTRTGTPQKIKVQPKGQEAGDDCDHHLTYRKPNTYSSSSLNLSPSSTRTESSFSSVPMYITSPGANLGVTSKMTSSTASLPCTNDAGRGFVYPSSRSRAHPRRDPPLGRKKKDDVVGASVEKNGKPKFSGLGIWLNKRRGSVGSVGDPNVDKRSSELVEMLDTGGPIFEASESGSRGSNDSSVRVGYGYGEGYTGPSPSHSSAPAMDVNVRRKQVGAKGKFRSYPLDPYDSLLLDNDRHTSELLRRLNTTKTPSFGNYGNAPPRSVLDLGCGQGHWVLDAAITWKGYGTHITGFDKVDVMKQTWAGAVSQGVADNITFVRGNFLEERLPFPDGNFDFIRMSCLTLCIPSDSWESVLQEVFRVLAPGGRLELIDDYLFFAYGKAPPLPDVSLPPSPTPTSPLSVRPRTSYGASTYSTCTFDTGRTNPGLELALSEEESTMSGVHGLYGLLGEDVAGVGGIGDDKNDETDTATLHGASQEKSQKPFVRVALTPQGVFQPTQPLTVREWNQQQAVSKDLEALFGHLLTQNYGIHTNSLLTLKMLKGVFGHAREMATMHLTFPPTDAGNSLGRGEPDANQNGTGVFADCPGLILWPSTLVPMSPAEIEVHTSKHSRVLLSCKNNLIKHAIEATGDKEIDEESVLEALWEYENFLRQRFCPPPGAGTEKPAACPPKLRELEPGQKPSYQSTSSSSRMSAISEMSASAENQDAMREYQLDFLQHFAWPDDTTEAQDIFSRTPGLGTANGTRSPFPKPVNKRDTTASTVATIVPPYSHIESTHVRTFRVYEAIKMDEMSLGTLSDSHS